MHATRKLWTWLAVICVLSFAALGWVGREIYLKAPPIPQHITNSKGEVLFTGAQIQHGQQAWLSAGGQQLGTVWGHGSYVAPDWSADWLHREALAIQAAIAQRDYGRAYADLAPAQRGAVDSQVKSELRANTYDAASGNLVLSELRATAVRSVAGHYEGLFGNDASLDKLREQYAMNAGSLPDGADRQALTGFFFWSAWAAAADRPGEVGLSYTSNWPHDALVGNTPTAGTGIWSIASVILMIAAIAGMIFYHSAAQEEGDP
ncbi:MAG: nitric-oxide reductase large subunit, partial [Massilia sp.]